MTQFQYHHQEESENQLETHRAIQDIYFEEVLIHFLFEIVDCMREAERKREFRVEQEREDEEFDNGESAVTLTLALRLRPSPHPRRRTSLSPSLPPSSPLSRGPILPTR